MIKIIDCVFYSMMIFQERILKKRNVEYSMCSSISLLTLLVGLLISMLVSLICHIFFRESVFTINLRNPHNMWIISLIVMSIFGLMIFLRYRKTSALYKTAKAFYSFKKIQRRFIVTCVLAIMPVLFFIVFRLVIYGSIS